ncbi:MAG TPA: carbohydrate-binding family 9-like protein [Flavisolibacter sp.]|nr:carbohydrate-binding family 9-like protein [Flavisolibacter sp.]
MNQLTVSLLKDINYDDAIETVSLRLNKIQKHELYFTPWSGYPYKPEVQFSIVHSGECIFLKYFVTEHSIRAAAGNINGAVWEDACVEFFVSFDDQGYYNLEFNCIGTALTGFGKEKGSRVRLEEAVIRKIKYGSYISNIEEERIHWELTVAVPLEVFAYHKLSPLSGRQCRANFYKCGDALPQPHFVAWSNIVSPQPNFHLPQFFGTLLFE